MPHQNITKVPHLAAQPRHSSTFDIHQRQLPATKDNPASVTAAEQQRFCILLGSSRHRSAEEFQTSIGATNINVFFNLLNLFNTV